MSRSANWVRTSLIGASPKSPNEMDVIDALIGVALSQPSPLTLNKSELVERTSEGTIPSADKHSTGHISPQKS